MPTKHANFASQAFQEIYGQVIGLYGDPANQVPGNNGTLINTAYTYIGGGLEADKLRGNIFWSRVLLVELLFPKDTSGAFAGLVLVLKPRSFWLFEQNATTIADFIGNTVSKDDLGQAGHVEIAEVFPAYRKGDIIRIGTLPSPLNVQDFFDGYYKALDETYEGTTSRYPGVTGGFNNISILGLQWDSTRYINTNATQILYYDKNIDGRCRIAGKADQSGSEITMKLCVGGVTSTYKIKGRRIA